MPPSIPLAYSRRSVLAPVIWVVTEGDAAERRIARLLGEAGRARGRPLPVLLTTASRLASDPDGPLGAVWRGLDDAPGDERLYWLPPDGCGAGQAAPVSPEWVPLPTTPRPP